MPTRQIRSNTILVSLLILVFCSILNAAESDLKQKVTESLIGVAFEMGMKEHKPEPSKGVVPSVYDNKAIPANVDKAVVEKQIEKMSNSIFFFGYANEGHANLEMDAFVIPNGDYAEILVEWNKTSVGEQGENLIRSATADELEEDKRFSRKAFQRIYYNGDSKPDMAWGKMQIKVPVAYDKIHFDAKEVGATKHSGAIDAILHHCDNDVVNVEVTGKFQRDQIHIALVDKTGCSLANGESMTMNRDGKFSFAGRVQGTIAGIEVFLPTDYWSGSFDIIATSEPKSDFDGKFNAKVSRFMSDLMKPEFKIMDSEAIKQEIEIVARRSYAYSGYNSPQILVKFPMCDNSGYAVANMEKLELFNEAGEVVECKPSGGIFDFKGMRSRFGLKVPGDDKNKEMLEYSRSVGQIKIKYPVQISVLKFTKDNNQNNGVSVSFDGSQIGISGLGDHKTILGMPDKLAMISGYDTEGRKLKKVGFSRNKTVNGVKTKLESFWGEPETVEVVVIDKWLECELPFDMAAAEKLPEDQKGKMQLGIDY